MLKIIQNMYSSFEYLILIVYSRKILYIPTIPKNIPNNFRKLFYLPTLHTYQNENIKSMLLLYYYLIECK